MKWSHDNRYTKLGWSTKLIIFRGTRAWMFNPDTFNFTHGIAMEVEL